jgi:hypothetical protein
LRQAAGEVVDVKMDTEETKDGAETKKTVEKVNYESIVQ